MSGLVTAVAAARHGAAVALMHDRAVLGGNASSECRVHVCGADRFGAFKNMRETGILEEIRLANLRRNPQQSWAVWDTILYEKARFQPGLTLLLNCSCMAAEMDGRRIVSVTGWQSAAQTRQKVRAKIFCDCSGDGVLAPLAGAEFRVGREARDEYGESLAPIKADDRTMGNSILFVAREHETPQPFEPLAWAHVFEDCDELPYGQDGHDWYKMGYWWVELGGEQDTIGDAEALRDELLKISYGVWDHIKNRCRHKHRAANWALEWMQFLPAKRESRRYVGEHVLTQNDIESGGRFDDLVAYGGWTMDDHDPRGFWAVRSGAEATAFNQAPVPYGIPYRSLYSKNVANLMCGGRCHSATHMAMSSTRVMGTGCSMAQAAGTAAAMAARMGIDPAAVGEHIGELQQALLRDDCYLPWVTQGFGALTTGARLLASRGDPEPLRDGIARPVGDDSHCWVHRPGDAVEMRFAREAEIDQLTLILDSGLDKTIQMSHHVDLGQLTSPPPELQKAFVVEGLAGGDWKPLARVTDNHGRLFRLRVGRRLEAIRYTLHQTHGQARHSKLFAMYVD